MKHQSRRTFLKNSALATVAMSLIPNERTLCKITQAGLTLDYIDFEHRSNSETTDALTIRRNFRSYLPEHSWDRQRDIMREPSIAAYSIRGMQGRTIEVLASITLNDTQLVGEELRVRAVEITDGNQTLLGVSSSEALMFSSVNSLNHPMIKFTDTHLNEVGVNKSKLVLQWQYRSLFSQTWIDFARTEHTIYTVLDKPNLPWRQLPDNPRVNTQLPWTEVLDWACLWAKGTKSLSDAAARIAENIYAIGGKEVSFHGIDTYVRYGPGDYTDGDEVFHCSSFLDLLNGRPTRAPQLHCIDLAAAVCTFANILGCDLQMVELNNAERQGFKLNPILPMGFRSSTNPETIGFYQTHVVPWQGSWEGAEAANGIIFDATQKLDHDVDPATEPHEWRLPTSARFGEQTEIPAQLGYLQRLTAPNERLKCIPQRAYRMALDAAQRPFSSQRFSLIASRSELAELQEPSDERGYFVVRGYSPTGREARGWRLLRRQSEKVSMWIAARTTQAERLNWYWTLSNGRNNTLVELSVVERNTPVEAHEVMIQMLQNFDVPLIPMLNRRRIGDAGLIHPAETHLLFRRANLVVQLKNVGAVMSPVLQLAKRLDSSLGGRLIRRR